MRQILILFGLVLLLSACSEKGGALDVVRSLFGYIPPPKKLTLQEEITLEYERCTKIDPQRNCAQIAYDIARKVHGLEPRKVPEGVVIILQEPAEDPQQKQQKLEKLETLLEEEHQP